VTAAAKTREALSRDRVLSEAVRLADASGLESLSMRRLGDALGVEAMSLYHHVANKSDLLDGMVDHIFGEIDFAVAADTPWNEALRAQAISARDVLTRHQWAIGLLDTRSSPGPTTMDHFETSLRCLRTAGFSVELAVRAYGVIYGYVYGYVFAFPAEPGEQARQVVERAAPSRYPYATEASEYMVRRDSDHGRAFQAGLDLILDGLHQSLAEGPTRKDAR
jgi:AcrR family transcriptional regulator